MKRPSRRRTAGKAEGDQSPFDVGFRLNDIPMSALASSGSSSGKPRDAFRALVGSVET